MYSKIHYAEKVKFIGYTIATKNNSDRCLLMPHSLPLVIQLLQRNRDFKVKMGKSIIWMGLILTYYEDMKPYKKIYEFHYPFYKLWCCFSLACVVLNTFHATGLFLYHLIQEPILLHKGEINFPQNWLS